MSLHLAVKPSKHRCGLGAAAMAAMILSVLPAQGAAAPNGKTLFEESCATCHTVKRSEPVGMAPPLGGVVGRKVASVAGWGYSPALRKLGGQWTPARIDAFLADPQKVARGSSMGYQETGAAERAAVIQYLKTLKP